MRILIVGLGVQGQKRKKQLLDERKEGGRGSTRTKTKHKLR
jgi:hypothetical protein